MAQILQMRIKAQDQASPVLKKVAVGVDSLSEKTRGLKIPLAAAAAAFASLAAGAALAVREFAKQEQAITRLGSNLQLAGVQGDDARDHFVNVAAAIQEVTAVSDTAVIELQSLFTALGASPEQLEKAARAAIDVSAATGKSVEEVGRQIAKTFGGFAGELGETIPALKELTKEQLQAGAAVDLLAERFEGAAKNQAKTLIGQLETLRNVIGDILKGIGSLIAAGGPLQGVFDTIVGGLKEVAIFFGQGTIESQIKQMINVFGELANIIEFLAERLPRALGGDRLQRVADDFRDRVKNLRENLSTVRKEQEITVQVAQRQFEAQKAINNVAVQSNKLAQERRKEAEKLLEVQQKYRDDQASKSLAGSITGAAQSQNLEVIAQQRALLAERLNVINLESAQTAKEFENLVQRKQLLEDGLRLLDESTQSLIDAQRDARQGAGFGVAQSALSGSASGVGQGIATLLGAGGPMGQLVGLTIQLVENAEQIPDLLRQMLDGLVRGLVEGVPKLIEYLSGEFIVDLLTDFLPSLVQGLAQLLPTLIAAAIRSVVSIVANLPKLIGGIFKGIGAGIIGGIKSIGNAIGGLFGFGRKSPEQKLAEVMAQLVNVFEGLNAELRAATQSARFNLSGTAGQIDIVRGNLAAAGSARAAALGEFDELGRRGKEKEAAEALQRATQAQLEQIRLSEQLFNLEIRRLDEALERERQLVETEIERFEEQKRVAETQKRAAQDLINTYTSLRDGAVSAIQSVRDQILGVNRTPGQNVEALQEAFANAGTPEERAQAAQALAGGLQAQFTQAQQLAAQGAISGEEFNRIQADILDQLAATEQETVNEFDRLISVQERIVATQDQVIRRADTQIDVLRRGFEAFEASIERQRQDLKNQFTQMLNRLDNINVGISRINTSFNSRSFNENIGNFRGRIQGF